MLKRIFTFALCILCCLTCNGCGEWEMLESTPSTDSISVPGTIYLYGESHSNPEILALELELWQEYYHDYGMRHLFVEYAYYAGAYLNLWMQSDDDTILDQLFKDWQGTLTASEEVRTFLKSIKETCPETVFHGTDVGHQYSTTGKRYLSYLSSDGMAETREYELTQEAISQGRTYYNGSEQDNVYREQMMAENFIREYSALSGESIMGIYGAAHTGLDELNSTGECDSMGKMLKAEYGDCLVSENLVERILREKEPEKVETLKIGEKEYSAEYFGKEDLSAFFPEYSCREFWRLEDAYDEFSQGTFTGNFLPQGNYPMLIEPGMVYVVRYTKTDGEVRTEYHVCDGTLWEESLITREVTVS